MSEQDKYDLEAAQMFPCCWVALGKDEVDQQEPCPDDDPGCVACVKRPAVAAALRAQGVEIERLRIAASEATVDETEDYIRSKEAEIAKLKAQLAEAKQESQDNYTQGQKRGMDALSESNKYRYANFDDLPKELKDRLPRIR